MKHLKRWLKDQRSLAVHQFSRNNDYGRGLKDGLDMALEAAKEFEKGSVFDPALQAWLTPDSGTGDNEQ